MIQWCNYFLPGAVASPCPVSVFEASLVTERVNEATKISSNFIRASSRGVAEDEDANARGPGPDVSAQRGHMFNYIEVRIEYEYNCCYN